tara:strand:- start:71906 stop:72850 length:945 start_codon:yes stop_codon:yes gene_type:complete
MKNLSSCHASRSEDFDLIRVSGPDAERFLQGQLSCDLRRATAEQSVRGTLCNLKGRVISDLRVIRQEDADKVPELYLLTRSGMAEVILNTLSKYQVFFKVQLTRVTETHELIQLIADDLDQLQSLIESELPAARDQITTGPGHVIIRLPDLDPAPTRFEILLKRENDQDRDDKAQFISDRLQSECQPLDKNTWLSHDIRNGIVHIRPGQQELFTPQLLNYDLNGAVDFKKGCYTGQEVVARMHYRAEAKKRLGKVTLPAETPFSDLGLDEQKDLLISASRQDGRRDYLLIASTDAGRRDSRITLFTETEASLGS